MPFKRLDVTCQKVAVAFERTGGLSAAGRELGVSHHTIKHRLKVLNSEIFYKLNWKRRKKVGDKKLLLIFGKKNNLRQTAIFAGISYPAARKRLMRLSDSARMLPKIKGRDSNGRFKS